MNRQEAIKAIIDGAQRKTKGSENTFQSLYEITAYLADRLASIGEQLGKPGAEILEGDIFNETDQSTKSD